MYQLTEQHDVGVRAAGAGNIYGATSVFSHIFFSHVFYYILYGGRLSENEKVGYDEDIVTYFDEENEWTGYKHSVLWKQVKSIKR